MASNGLGDEGARSNDSAGGEVVSFLDEKDIPGVPEDISLSHELHLSCCPENLRNVFSSVLESTGLDIHPFLVGWYNKTVGPKFQLDYSDETLAFVIISGPDIFETCIVPYVQSRLLEDPDFKTESPLDDSMKHVFGILKEDIENAGFQVETLQDFDLHPSRRPKILVQTAAHVAGAVQYFHKNNLPKDVQITRFSEQSDLSGVAIHPTYGGWYAIRGVVILPSVVLPQGGLELKKPEPVQIFTEEETIAHVIELFAYKWQTNEWRDLHRGAGVKYSDNFVEYLRLETSKRWEFVKSYCVQNPINE